MITIEQLHAEYNLHAEIDRMAEEAHAEGRRMAQRALDEISVKVGWMIRSDAQRRRYQNAAKIKQGDLK